MSRRSAEERQIRALESWNSQIKLHPMQNSTKTSIKHVSNHPQLDPHSLFDMTTVSEKLLDYHPDDDKRCRRTVQFHHIVSGVDMDGKLNEEELKKTEELNDSYSSMYDIANVPQEDDGKHNAQQAQLKTHMGLRVPHVRIKSLYEGLSIGPEVHGTFAHECWLRNFGLETLAQ